jgi:hypothetical protein
MLPASAALCPSPEAEAFVRFCYQRRRVSWPELYDEMCAVATRGLFHGMGQAELAEVGIGFSLSESPQLAQLVTAVVAQERAERRAARAEVLEATRSSRATDDRVTQAEAVPEIVGSAA